MLKMLLMLHRAACHKAVLQIRQVGQLKHIHVSAKCIKNTLLPTKCCNASLRTSARLFCTDADSKEDRSPAVRSLSYKSFEDYLFSILCDDTGKVSITRFLNDVRATGLRLNDPRLAESMSRFNQIRRNLTGDVQAINAAMLLEKDDFHNCIKENLVLYHRAFTSEFIIPDFTKFTTKIEKIFTACKENKNGKVADYIPQLSRVNPDLWGMALCTIDGQRSTFGDVDVPFCLQSCSKPLTYTLVLNELGSEHVHQYVGHEPSGETFNMIKLDSRNKPHNPMINAGAIVMTSLIKSNERLPDRFDYVQTQYKKMAGEEFVGFNNAVFLSERETADRNFSLGYYLKENKCFPEGTNLMETLDFYFQLCSVEVNCNSGSVMAATLANGGVCPTTGETIMTPEAVRDTLSLMYSCGMYDYSGQFAFKVGLPSKSGVGGGILLVIPNVMGMCLYSPLLDKTGNSVRGLQFCEELVRDFNFHNYDNLKHTRKKEDPCRRISDLRGQEIMTLLFGAFNGDLATLKRMALAGVNMSQADYDGRTALHISAAEGYKDCVLFLVEKCKVSIQTRDRWGQTPIDDAVQFKRTEVAEILKKCQKESDILTETEERNLYKGAYVDE